MRVQVLIIYLFVRPKLYIEVIIEGSKLCDGIDNKSSPFVPHINYQWAKATDLDNDKYCKTWALTYGSKLCYCTCNPA